LNYRVHQPANSNTATRSVSSLTSTVIVGSSE
jgi:hypothetical protein